MGSRSVSFFGSGVMRYALGFNRMLGAVRRTDLGRGPPVRRKPIFKNIAEMPRGVLVNV